MIIAVRLEMEVLDSELSAMTEVSVLENVNKVGEFMKRRMLA